MRKNTARHWLHAILDLLPVLTIGIFAINIINRSPEPIEIHAQDYEVVKFNQYVDITRYDEYWVKNSDYEITFNDYAIPSYALVCGYIPNYDYTGHKFLISYDYEVPDISVVPIIYTYVGSDFYGLTTGFNQYITELQLIDVYPVIFRTLNNDLSSIYSGSLKLNVFDLTYMFGAGNEPTINQFNSYFNGFYDFTLSENVLLDVGSLTFNDTDIGSQFVYSLYHVVDKYFNMGNVFNMSGVYDWFNLNIFNGNAPISIYIVWNIVLYEFVMDLLFLLYSLFMWFIDMLKRLMEKPLDSIK